MSDTWKRPDPQELDDAYRSLFSSNIPLAKLKDAAFNGRLLNQSSEKDGVVGRSMSWKLFLIEDAPLTVPPSETTAKPPMQALLQLRKEYTNLLLDKMRAPDGSYEDGFSIPGIDHLPRASENNSANLEKNNPLSLHEDNPWKQWFAAVELRRTIRQDVERTFPDVEYFRDPLVQAQLTTILYLHSSLHPDIGYRQGMHELLAPVFYAVDYDSIPDDGIEGEAGLKDFCSRTWVDADAWALFSRIMTGVSSWYEWREPDPIPLPSPLKAQFRHGPSEGEASSRPYVAPIVLACQRLQAEMLKMSDPVLWQAMQKAGIEPQIYGIRWLRLLFTREFTLPDAMVIWDGILCCDCGFELAPWVCIAMLIRIRNQLIPSDYSGQLTSLLRYPTPPDESNSFGTRHTILLLRQAYALYTSPSPATGASIAVENHTFLDIPIDVPEPPPRPQRRRVESPGQPTRRKSISELQGKPKANDSSVRFGKERNFRQSIQLGLPEAFAKGLLEKGESLGINRTVMNAVAELRKNIPDLAGQLMRSPAAETAMYGTFPLAEERQGEERPPWEPRTRFEMEKEIAELRSTQKRLGIAVGVAVDSLLLDEGADRDEETLKLIRQKKREALESLAYIKDLLKGPTAEIDEERLLGEIEYKKRKEALRAQEEAEAGKKSETTSPSLRPPEPAAAAAAARQLNTSDQPSSPPQPSHPLAALPRSPPVFRSSPEPPLARPLGPSATLPRRAGPSTTASPTAFAPWNYTRSSFSSPSFDSGSLSLPRPPPRSSAAIRPTYPPTSSSSDQPPRPSKVVNTDPLGAVPR